MYLDAWEREEANLERQLEDGVISEKDYREAMRDLAADRRQAAEEEAAEVMVRWGYGR